MIEIKIYTITNPIDNKIFYVGRSTTKLSTRLFGHYCGVKRGESNKDKAKILTEIQLSGQMPIIEEIDSIICENEIDEIKANNLENYWISQIGTWGFVLYQTKGVGKFAYNSKPLINWEKMKKKQTIEELKSEGLVTTANKVLIRDLSEFNFSDELAKMEKKWKDTDIALANFDKLLENSKWMSEIEAYCGEMGILPADLIETHRQSLKMARKGLKQGKKETFPSQELDKRLQSNFRANLVKQKTGYES